MSEIGITLGMIAIVVVAMADIIVRLRIGPHRRDEFLEDLLESMTEREPVEQLERAPQAATRLDDSLIESLVRYFELSATSRYILNTLALRTEGMSESEVLSAVNNHLASQRRRELPEAVVQKVAKLLTRTGLTARHDGKFEITNAGRHLYSVLQARSTRSTPAAAFA